MYLCVKMVEKLTVDDRIKHRAHVSDDLSTALFRFMANALFRKGAGPRKSEKSVVRTTLKYIIFFLLFLLIEERRKF